MYPRSAVSGSTEIEIRGSKHLFLRQSLFAGKLREWIEAKRKRVEEATNGRVGYIYVPSTGLDGQAELARHIAALAHHEIEPLDVQALADGQLAAGQRDRLAIEAWVEDDRIAAVELMPERHDFSIDLGAHALVGADPQRVVDGAEEERGREQRARDDRDDREQEPGPGELPAEVSEGDVRDVHGRAGCSSRFAPTRAERPSETISRTRAMRWESCSSIAATISG